MNEEVKKLIESVKVYQHPVPLCFDSIARALVDKSDFDRVVKELTDWNKVGDKFPDEHIPVLCKTKTNAGGTYIYFVGYYEPVAGYFYDANRVYRLVTEWKPII